MNPIPVWLLMPRSDAKRRRVARQLVEKQPVAPPPDDDAIRAQLRPVREDAADNLDALVESLTGTLAGYGVTVHVAATAAEAAVQVAGIAGPGRRVAVNKSAVVDELRSHLSAHGLAVVDTYDGQYTRPEEGVERYWQLTPPTGEAAWETFARPRAARPETLDGGLTGLLGVNAIAAEDGSTFFVQHLHNISETLNRAGQVVLLVGLDKIVRHRAGAELVARAMARFGAASVALGVPERGSTEETPPPIPPLTPADEQRFHVILLDNGRRHLLADARFRDLFLCIGCRACQRECPTFPYFSAGTGWKPRDYLLAFLRGEADSLAECSSCGRCHPLCPLDINIPVMISEAEGDHPLAVRDRLYSNIETLFKLSSLAAPLANLSFDLSWLRPPMEWVAGLDRRRKLPKFHRRTFARQWPATERGGEVASPLAGGNKRVAYYYGCYVNYTDPALGQAVVEVLERNGFRVDLPPQSCCGVASFSYGDVGLARRYAQANAETLARWVERGYEIVVSCPSCGLALRRDFPHLLPGSAAARLVAEHTHDVGPLLLDAYRRGELDTGFRPIEQTVGYHVPCHLRVQGLGPQNVELLGLVPGLEVRVLDRGCCGMSGSYGLKGHNYEKSMAIGKYLFEALRDDEIDLGMTDCAGCEMQMRHGSGREVIHPMKLLRQAYEV